MRSANLGDARRPRRAPARRTALALAALLTGAAACSAGPGAARAPGAAADSYFPVVAGARWVYEVSAGLAGTSRLVVEARGTEPVRGAKAPLFVVHEHSDGGAFGMRDDGFAGYVESEGYVSRYSFLSEEPDGSLRLMGSEPSWVLPIEPRAGQRWTQRMHVFTSPENRGGEQVFEAEVDVLASVEVPAGRFDDVVVVRSRYLDPTVSKGPLVSYEDYYARGVGLIRSVSRNHETWWFLRTIEQRLVEVSFGGVLSRAGTERP